MTPIDPLKAAFTKEHRCSPPQGYLDPLTGEDSWRRRQGFTLLSPTQDFTLTALLQPLPSEVIVSLKRHRHWVGRGTHVSWPVRLWVDEAELRAEDVDKLLRLPPDHRGQAWETIPGRRQLEPLHPSAAESEDGNPKRAQEEGGPKAEAFGSQNAHKYWIVRFCDEAGAMSFWQAWHRTPFLSQVAQQSGGHPALIGVDPLW